MRYLQLLVIILIAAAGLATAQNSAPPSEQELAQLRRLEPQRAAEGLDYLTKTRERYGLDSRHTFRHVNSTTDTFGVFHGRYRQYFNGVRVAGGNAIVHIGRNGQMERPTTKLYDALSVPTAPAVSERDAIVTALAAANPGGRLTGLETSAVELVIHLETAHVDRGEPSRGQAASNPRYRRYEEVVRSHQLMWHVMVSSDGSELEPRVLLIDANTGVVMKQMDAADNETVNATGKGFFHGPKNFRTILQSGKYKAVDPDRGGDVGNVFLNANHTAHTSHKKYDAYTDDDNQWGDGYFDDGSSSTSSERAKSAVTDAHFAVGKAWDHLGVFGRNGWDNKGSQLFIRMHYGSDYKDAKFQTGGLAKNEGMFLGDGSSSTSLSTVSHELGHGFFHSIFGWTYKPNQEWAGLNEGNSDIFGTLTELYSYKAPGETKRYTDMEGEWRWHSRMINPLSYSPDGETTGYRYWEPGFGNKEEHNVGCLFGHMFIFLADGVSNDPASPLSSKFLGNGFSGIGPENAAFYWSRAMIHYLPEKGDFFDLRDAFLDAASNQFTPPVHRAAIAAAFTAIGVGGLTENGPDNQDPQIVSVTINKLDEAAGYLELAVHAVDLNMARVEVLLDGKAAFTDYRLPYGGPVNLIGLAPGNHSITVRAYDIFGNMSSTIRAFSLKGVRNLIVNGGFEDTGGWSSTGGQSETNSERAFAGNRYARMSPLGEIWQDVTIPANATNVRLLYRVRAENHDQGGFLNSSLEVKLINPATNAVIQTLATHKEGVETFDNALTKTYKQMNIGGISHRGAVRVSFSMPPVLPTLHRFKVDNVALTYDVPTSASVSAIVRNGEETVEFSTAISGFDPASIKGVLYYLDDAYEKGGDPVVSGSGPDFRAIISTKGLSKKQHVVVASVLYVNNTEAIKAGAYFTVGAVNDLIKNGDFETGYQFWPVTGGTIMVQPVLDMPNPCFLGIRCALLGASPAFPTTTAEQYFTMPPVPQSAKLSYRLRIKTNEPNPNAWVDNFRVYIVDSNNKKWQIGDTFSNATPTTGYKGYDLVEHNLPQGLLKAGSLKLMFETQQNNVHQTHFYVDNVSLVVTSLGVQLP